MTVPDSCACKLTCPTHESAGKLLERLRALVQSIEKYDTGEWPELERAREVIAEAEGR